MKNLYFSAILAMKIEDIALSYVHGLGWRGATHLAEVFGDSAAVFAATKEELIGEAELRADIAASIVSKSSFEIAKRELSLCQKHGITPLAATDDLYPERLLFVQTHPYIIYMVGNPSLLHYSTIVAFAGERGATNYGEQNIWHSIEHIASVAPECIIASTMEEGTDSTIIRSALHNGLRVVGVTNCPLTQIAPQSMQTLSGEIIDAGGAVISGVGAMAAQSEDRRGMHHSILAGISDAVVIVESCKIHPVAQAADGYGRTVLAVPGRTTDPLSQGTNRMIATGMAQMLCSNKDIVEYLGLENIC